MGVLLRIANFILQINSKDGAEVSLEEGYKPFLISATAEKPHMVINAYCQLPKQQIPRGKVLYSAKMPEGELWNVAKSGDTYIFNIFDSERPGVLQQVCTTNSTFKEWNVYMATSLQQAAFFQPIKYPLGPLLMYYLTVKNEALMIHASGISDAGVGRIFTGVSGKGKSTMAKLWFDNGAGVINDDRLIIRKETSGYSIHNTPMFYADEPRKAALHAAYIIYHAKQNKLEEQRGAHAVAALAANCIQHGYNRAMLEHHLAFLSEMVNHIRVYALGVVPNASVLQTIRSHG